MKKIKVAQFGLGPSAGQLVTADCLHMSLDLARKHGAGMHMHCVETRVQEYCIRRAEALATDAAAVAHRTKVPSERVETILASLVAEKKVFTLAPGLYMHQATAAEAIGRVLKAVDDFHAQSAESPGIPPEVKAKLFTENAVSTKPMGTGLGTKIVPGPDTSLI